MSVSHDTGKRGLGLKAESREVEAISQVSAEARYYDAANTIQRQTSRRRLPLQLSHTAVIPIKSIG